MNEMTLERAEYVADTLCSQDVGEHADALRVLRDELDRLRQAKAGLRMSAVPGPWERAGFSHTYGERRSRRPYTVFVWDGEPTVSGTINLGIVQRKYAYTWKWEIKGEPTEYHSMKHALGELLLRHISYVRPKDGEARKVLQPVGATDSGVQHLC